MMMMLGRWGAAGSVQVGSKDEGKLLWQVVARGGIINGRRGPINFLGMRVSIVMMIRYRASDPRRTCCSSHLPPGVR